MNLQIKFAILTSRCRTQRQASIEAQIPEGRLTAAIRGRVSLTAAETARLARVLDVPVATLTTPVPPTCALTGAEPIPAAV